MGLPLRATIGEERTISEDYSIDDIINGMGSLGFSLTIAKWSVAGFKALIASFGKAIAAEVNPYVGAIINGSVIATAILNIMKMEGAKGFTLTYTYKYEFLYGDPTTVPRWSATHIDYDVF